MFSFSRRNSFSTQPRFSSVRLSTLLRFHPFQELDVLLLSESIPVLHLLVFLALLNETWVVKTEHCPLFPPPFFFPPSPPLLALRSPPSCPDTKRYRAFSLLTIFCHLIARTLHVACYPLLSFFKLTLFSPPLSFFPAFPVTFGSHLHNWAFRINDGSLSLCPVYLPLFPFFIPPSVSFT